MGGGAIMSIEHREEGFPNFPSATSANPLCEKIAGMTINSIPNLRTFGGPDPLAYPGWDGATFPCSSYPVSLENCGMVTTSHTGQYYSDPGIAETVAKLPFIGSEIFSEMVGSFCLAECGQVPNTGSLSIYPSNEDGGTTMASNGSRYAVCQHAGRREKKKISERMKLLQDLVPGCNKVTGKALMLDEIINYVQSLQHQVKFLLTKLANVNPELNVDLERLLSKDILHSSSSATILGSGHGINPSYYDPNGIPWLHPMPQAMCESRLHNAFQTGYDSKPPNGNLGLTGERGVMDQTNDR